MDYFKSYLPIITAALQAFKSVLLDLKSRQSFIHLFALAATLSVASGIALYLIDPAIHTPLDGIWSAWVTMTQVGFGDVVPTSFFGRAISAVLILFGLILFSLFTATLSAVLMDKKLSAWDKEVRQIEQETRHIEVDEAQILRELTRLHDRMAALEKQLAHNKHDPK